MSHESNSLCITCGDTYRRANRYHGYYCTDCRVSPGDRRSIGT
ncbi:DUF7564 family protein [Natrarchaeobaculum sulfurireducens]